MAIKGPKPKPRELQAKRGNPGKRKLKPDQPELPIGVPEKPKWLTRKGAAQWDLIVPRLVEVGAVHITDSEVLGTYCNLLARSIELQEYLDKHGEFTQQDTGRRIVKPEAKWLAEYEKRLLRLQEAIGLTPRAKRSISLEIKPAKSETERAQEQRLKKIFKEF